MKKSILMFGLALITMLGLSSCREDGKWDDSLFFEGEPTSRIFIKERSGTGVNPPSFHHGGSTYTYYEYNVKSFIKNFSLKGGGENKISKIEYKVSFKYQNQGEKVKSYTFTELIDPSQSSVVKSNVEHNIDEWLINSGAQQVQFYDAEVTIIGHTQLGKSLTKTLTNVPVIIQR